MTQFQKTSDWNCPPEDSSSEGESDPEDGKETIKYQLTLCRHAIVQAHAKKVKSICIHHRKELIYSIGEDKRLTVSALGENREKLYDVKCSNFMPKTIAIHQDLNRAYVSMKEGMLFVFDI